MKRFMIYPFIVLLAMLSVSAETETVFESLAPQSTNFEFTVNDLPLEVSSQGITLRAVTREIRTHTQDGVEVVNHVAYRSYHLEIAYELKFNDQRGYQTMEFYQGSELLHEMPIKDDSRVITSTGHRRYQKDFMALNLEGVPMVMLDSVDRINLRKAK